MVNIYTFIVCTELFPQTVHLCIAITVGNFATQRQCRRSIVIYLLGGLWVFAHQPILFVVGDADLRTDRHHQLRHHLGVIDENGFYGSVQHANAQCSLFATVFEHILVAQQIVAEIATRLEPHSLLLFFV